MVIKGKIVELTSAVLSDRQNVYNWCFHSETTKSHSGLPDYPEAPIATPEEFFDSSSGYADYFFDGTQPEKGRGYIILFDNLSVGFVSYSSFHLKQGLSELDIWMNYEANCGKGFGSDALIALGKYLNENMGIDKLLMRPSIKNERAIKSYMKAGFEKSNMLPIEYLLEEYVELFGSGDYGTGGDVLLVKKFM